MTVESTSKRSFYWSAAGVAAVAAAFLAVVAVVMVSDLVRLQRQDPRTSQALAAMKAELTKEPARGDLKQRIRRLDLEVRRDHFELRRRADVGARMLLGGAAAFLLAAGLAAWLRAALPAPEPEDAEAAGRLARLAAHARLGVAAVAILAAGTALGAWLALPPLPEAPLELGLAPTPGAGETPATRANPATPSAATATASAPALPSAQEYARNWPRFRGTGGTGIVTRANIPAQWDGPKNQNILWKSPVPLPGENSPIVWGKKVFCSGADRDAREVYCFDADTGRLLWKQPVASEHSPAEPPTVLSDTGYAAPTMATDGARVYALFANGDLAAFDLDGQAAWIRNLGLPANDYGHASSLLTFNGRLIVQYDQAGEEDGKSQLLAFDGATGKSPWSVDRPVAASWTTPVVASTPKGPQLLTMSKPWVIAYDPEGGDELWRAKIMEAEDIACSPTWADGLAFFANAGSKLHALKTDGAGDVTETHVAWSAEDGLSDICSPLAGGGFVYLLTTAGTVTCYEAATGKKMYEKELESSIKSSPSLVGDRLYMLDAAGVMHVVQAGAEFKELARCPLGEESNCCPAFGDGRIYIRAEKNLYCIGK